MFPSCSRRSASRGHFVDAPGGRIELSTALPREPPAASLGRGPAAMTSGSLSEASARITAYWADECARNLDKLMTHFTGDAEVVTPDGVFHGHDAVAGLYRKSFADFPGLAVDVT